MATTPTSLIKRLMGLEPMTDGLQIAASILLAIPAGTTTLTISQALHAGKILTIASSGGLAITPPAAVGSGSVYTFVVTTTIAGGNFTFDAKAGNASDLIYGISNTNKVATGLTQWGTVANTNLITWNGTTLGGVKGDFLQMVDVGLNMWLCEIVGQQSGTVATPFSNH